MEKKRLTRKWLLLSALGLALFGFGLSLIGEALIRKYEANSIGDWFWYGTLALVVTNSGLAIFGKAVTMRVRLDRLKE